MQASLEAMQVAVRVLTALTERREPDAVDVRALRIFAEDAAAADADELACDVLQRALWSRSLARKQRAAGA